jgi:hypothetical protein
LAYDADEYKGELYRMNISCFAEGQLPSSGYLYFKVLENAMINNGEYYSIIIIIDTIISDYCFIQLSLTTLFKGHL